MPSEADIKAKIAAALAAKKKPADPQSTAPTPAPAPAPTPPPAAATPKPAVEATPPEQGIDRRAQTAQPPIEDTGLTFFGQPIRIAKHNQSVYFCLSDLLQLTNDAESTNKFLEFKNNPATKGQADTLIKVLTFTNTDGSDKTDGAKAMDALTIIRALKLTLPGPFARWALEIEAANQNS